MWHCHHPYMQDIVKDKDQIFFHCCGWFKANTWLSVDNWLVRAQYFGLAATGICRLCSFLHACTLQARMMILGRHPYKYQFQWKLSPQNWHYSLYFCQMLCSVLYVTVSSFVIANMRLLYNHEIWWNFHYFIFTSIDKCSFKKKILFLNKQPRPL